MKGESVSSLANSTSKANVSTSLNSNKLCFSVKISPNLEIKVVNEWKFEVTYLIEKMDKVIRQRLKMTNGLYPLPDSSRKKL